MKQYNGEKYIVSFTSFGKRMASCPKMVFCLLKQTYKNFHIVLTLYKEDYKNIPETVQLLIDNDIIEVIEADKELGPHLKYFYAMKKYWDKPIITVDDDRMYDNHTIERLVRKYEEIDYKSIISNCAIEIQKNRQNRILPYTYWVSHRLQPNKKSIFAMAEGFAGVLYPPKCFDLDNDEWINNLLQCKYDDDLFLKVQGIKYKIPVTQSNFKLGYQETDNIKEMMQYNLHNNQNKGNTNRNNLCYKFESQLLKAWEN